jgi:hypothetical protein
MSGSDLVSARYPLDNPVDLILGRPSFGVQSNLPARSNLSYLGGLAGLSDHATVATKKGLFVAIQVGIGDVISKVNCLIGATEGKTGVKSFVALYSGLTGGKEPALLGQSKVAEAAIKPSKVLSEALESPVQITVANAPNGFVYAGLTVEATTINTAVSALVPTACQGEWFKGGAEALSVSVEQKEAGIAAATFKPVAAEVCPIIFLS